MTSILGVKPTGQNDFWEIVRQRQGREHRGLRHQAPRGEQLLFKIVK